MTAMKKIELIPIRDIRVLNPRERNQKKFKQIAENIANVGLKKPITVAKRTNVKNGEAKYDLACGQGRLEAFLALGYEEIPAIVEDLSKEDRLLVSLVENLARRYQTTLEQVKEIVALKERGHKPKDIAGKIDRSESYINGILRLWSKGEERLIQAVEKGRIPLNVAVTIANAEDKDVQRALADAYEDQKLKGTALLKARRVVEQRLNHGRKLTRIRGKKHPLSANSLVRAYEQETQKQQHFIKKAHLCEVQLLFITTALRQLLDDENFRNLLRAENLGTLPKNLADQIGRKEAV
jgi:ParB family transcriptional regulator, chromosome partitioning protein